MDFVHPQYYASIGAMLGRSFELQSNGGEGGELVKTALVAARPQKDMAVIGTNPTSSPFIVLSISKAM